MENFKDENTTLQNNTMIQTAIPDLLKLLVDDDLVIVQQASVLLSQMSRINILRTCLIQTQNACQCIVNCLNTTADLETARNLISTLYGISIDLNNGVPTIIRSSALDPLIKILNAPLEVLVSTSLSTIHNILLIQDPKVKVDIRNLGGVNQLITLLNKTDNLKFLTVLVDCLYLLTLKDIENKKLIHDLGGVQVVMSVFLNTSYLYEKLDIGLLKFLKSLSVYQPNKVLLLNYGVLDKLVLSRIKNLNDYLVLLLNLSDQMCSMLNNLIEGLFNLLNQSTVSDSNKKIILKILSNATSNNESNKMSLINLNIIILLVNYLNNREFVEPCLWILKNLITFNPLYLTAQDQLKNSGLILLKHLTYDQQYLIPLLRLLKVMCRNRSNFYELRKVGLVERLVEIMTMPLVNIECLEMCSNCLLFMCKEVENRNIIRKSSSLFKQMMTWDNVQAQNIGLTLYYETNGDFI